MNLWIRSQDKEILMKIDNINLGLDVDSNEPCRLFTFVDGAVTSFTLGIYRSKERALEVLDEINNIKWYKYMAELSWDNFIKTIYAMPQSEMTKLFLNMNTYEMPKE